MTKWLLCDYGEVLALAPAPVHQAALEAEAGAAGPKFWARYWQHRPAYDRNDLDTVHYWTKVLGHRTSSLITSGVLSGSTSLCGASPIVRPLPRWRAAERGVKLAVLSNAPAELADSFDELPWLAPFNPRLFSGHLGIINLSRPSTPSPLPRWGPSHTTSPSSMTDQRTSAQPAPAGLRALLFSDPNQIDGM